jgi:hypothetical protein
VNTTITHEQLDTAEELVKAYLQECYDNLPLETQEQCLALAAAGLVPAGQEKFAETPIAGSAWVLATCWFLKMVHPTPLREAGHKLYKFLDSVELEDPAGWAATHNKVGDLIREAGHDVSDF